MEDGEESILIPIREYENYRNHISLQDRQSIIRDLQHLLLNKEEDLKRYKEKCEHAESVLQRTQKALDKRIQSEQTQISLPLRPVSKLPGSIHLSRPVARTKPQPAAPAVAVISRALGQSDDIKSTSHAASLPHQASRPGFTDDTSSLKSLPLNLGIGTPGMSTALLRRLVQENLKLKQQAESQKHPKAAKNASSLEKICELKQKVDEQEKIIAELSNQPGNEGKQAILHGLAAKEKQLQEMSETVSMDKIVIESLKDENLKVKHEKDDMEALLIQYRQFEITADENNEKILELERKLREAVEFNKAVETKNEAMATEVQKMKSDVEKVCGERDLLQANHTMLLQQMRTPSPAYTKKAPPPSAMTCGQSASLGMSQSHYQARTQQHFTQPQTMQSRSESPYTQYSRPPTHDPTHRMSQSCMAPSQSAAASHPPQPTERKTFKCPRCDKVFGILQDYRDHIKLCLNRS